MSNPMLLPSVNAMVTRLSKLQRDFLIDHVDGLRPWTNGQPDDMTRGALISRKLIRYEPDVKTKLGRPDGTMLTDLGREVLGIVLGDYADALVRAHYKVDRPTTAVAMLTMEEINDLEDRR